MTYADQSAPLVVHVVHALRVGGLENGLVNLINRTPPGRYRHAIVCMTDHDHFEERLQAREDVVVHDLHKRTGKDPAVYVRLWRLLRRLRPAIVHTRNMAALEAQVCAWLAGVPVRVHGEHGRDVHDLHGSNRRYRWMRRACALLVQRQIALSGELSRYLIDDVGLDRERVVQIINGVDLDRFAPDHERRAAMRAARGWSNDTMVFGWIGRMEAVKDPLALAEAYISLTRTRAPGRRIALAMVGSGSQAAAVRERLEAAGLGDEIWLPGSRDDVADVLRAIDVFVLPSLAEGISNTVLEAMASGKPVVATRVGGNEELVCVGETGRLVPAGEPRQLSAALAHYLQDPSRIAHEGDQARRRAEQHFGIDRMVSRYLALYDEARAARGLVAVPVESREEPR